METHSSSATSCAWAVKMPCPKSHFPVYAVTVPSDPTAIQESSCPGSTCERWVSNGPWAMANGENNDAALKLTISAPELFRNSRREALMLFSLMLCWRRHIFESLSACEGGRSSGTKRCPGHRRFPGQRLQVFRPEQLSPL